MKVLHNTSTPGFLNKHGQSLEFGDFDSRLIGVCNHNANLVVTDDSVMLETRNNYGVFLRRASRGGSAKQQRVGMNFVNCSSFYLHLSMRRGLCKDSQVIVPGLVDIGMATEATRQLLACNNKRHKPKASAES